MSTTLPEQGNREKMLNYQLKKGLQEGTDFMLVDERIYNIWYTRYGEDI